MQSHYPIAVQALEPYKLRVTFDNQETRLFDLAPYLDDRFFAPLKNPALFQAVTISPISIEWPGGIDICPDELYVNSIPQ
jgi:hypothetical protein